MKHCSSLSDISDIQELINLAKQIKKGLDISSVGQGKTLGLLFFNPSLRTRLSTYKAARILGMEVIIMNIGQDGWALEFEDGVCMDNNTSEHVREAAGVLSQYCDIIGVRAFPAFISKEEDEAEKILTSFKKYASVPILNLESATEHPLQALTDAMTIQEFTIKAPKIALTWAPHPKVLPQAVPNSFVAVMKQLSMDLVISNPSTHNLCAELTDTIPVFHHQDKALQDADIVYVKNWSSYEQYGKPFPVDKTWTFTAEKWALTNQAKVLHCLPVRRNVVIDDALLNNEQSAVLTQAKNRTYIAASVLHDLIKNNL